jgi:indole-3-glycerol phosphate synthase
MILDDILARTRVDVELRKHARPLAMFERDFAERPAPERRSLKAGLWAAETIGCIAEFKRRSPSAGWINETASLTETVKAYAAGGASALSVLTDAPFFAGSLDVLTVNGIPFLPFHFRGEGSLPVRDLAHVRPTALAKAREALRAFVAKLIGSQP